MVVELRNGRIDRFIRILGVQPQWLSRILAALSPVAFESIRVFLAPGERSASKDPSNTAPGLFTSVPLSIVRSDRKALLVADRSVPTELDDRPFPWAIEDQKTAPASGTFVPLSRHFPAWRTSVSFQARLNIFAPLISAS